MSGTNASWLERNQESVMNTYGRFPVAVVSGHGAVVTDADGNEYLDALSGIAVSALGHAHPVLTRAIQEQAGKLLHMSNLYVIPQQVELAEKLTEISFAEKAFFCNSGAEANEGAVKLARLYQHTAGHPEKKTILCFNRSFHGRTLAMITATGQPKYKEGFDPLPSGFVHVDFGDLEGLKSVLDDKTAAVLVEPVQMEGGVHTAPEGFLKNIRELCDGAGALLVLDEVQTGVGRTGKWFGYEHDGVAPDIMTLAKGLAGGVPIGAVLATEKVATAFTPGTHASTFGGNPLSCAAALAVLKTVQREGILDLVAERSAFFFEKLKKLAQAHNVIKEVRGRGYLVGIELSCEALPIVKALMREGVLAGVAGPNVLRFLPPLVITREQLDQVAAALDHVLSENKQ